MQQIIEGALFIDIETPDRGLAVGLAKGLYFAVAGVVTATPTVTCRDGTSKTLPPIYLIIVKSFYDV